MKSDDELMINSETFKMVFFLIHKVLFYTREIVDILKKATKEDILLGLYALDTFDIHIIPKEELEKIKELKELEDFVYMELSFNPDFVIFYPVKIHKEINLLISTGGINRKSKYWVVAHSNFIDFNKYSQYYSINENNLIQAIKDLKKHIGNISMSKILKSNKN